MRIPTSRLVIIDATCPRCRDNLALRQVGDTGDGPAQPTAWTDDERFCRRGCGLAAVPLRGHQHA